LNVYIVKTLHKPQPTNLYMDTIWIVRKTKIMSSEALINNGQSIVNSQRRQLQDKHQSTQIYKGHETLGAILMIACIPFRPGFPRSLTDGAQ